MKQISGWIYGALSGLTWGLDTALLGVIMATSSFQGDLQLLAYGAIVAPLLHDLFAAFYLSLITTIRKEWREVVSVLRTRDALFCVLGAVFGGPLAMFMYLKAIAVSSASLTATVTSCYPLLGSAMAVFVLKEKMQIKGWVGLLLCCLGVVYIGYSPTNLDKHIATGVFYASIAAIGWASEAVICAYGMRSGVISPRVALLLREWTSTLVYILVILPFALGGFDGLGSTIFSAIGAYDTLSLFLLTAAIGTSSFLMWYKAINQIGASKALCLNVTYSFWAIVFGVLLLDEKLSVNVIVGAGVIICGVIMSTIPSKTNKQIK